MASSYKPASYELVVDDGDATLRRSFHRTKREALAAWERSIRTDPLTSQVIRHDRINKCWKVIADHAME